MRPKHFGQDSSWWLDYKTKSLDFKSCTQNVTAWLTPLKINSCFEGLPIIDSDDRLTIKKSAFIIFLPYSNFTSQAMFSTVSLGTKHFIIFTNNLTSATYLEITVNDMFLMAVLDGRYNLKQTSRLPLQQSNKTMAWKLHQLMTDTLSLKRCKMFNAHLSKLRPCFLFFHSSMGDQIVKHFTCISKIQNRASVLKQKNLYHMNDL